MTREIVHSEIVLEFLLEVEFELDINPAFRSCSWRKLMGFVRNCWRIYDVVVVTARAGSKHAQRLRSNIFELV